jgi:eukaryotic-like serine/threonine-protein kinase
VYPNSALPLARLGEYELVRLIATGGMSEVYEARRDGPHGFHKRFALKRVLPQLAADERLLKMFCDEARVHSALSHPNLVQVIDFGEHAGELYMVLEYVDGPSLARVMSALLARGRKMPLAQALYIVRRVLDALEYAHTARDRITGLPLGVVHRDVAPSNILVGSAGEVKLADFGIVASVINDNRSNPGDIKGKLGYVSPEQAMGFKVDPRSDLFSTAVVLCEVLIGAPLFRGRTPVEILESLHQGDLSQLERLGAHLPPELLDVLRRTLSQDRQSRPGSARELGDELEAVVRRYGLELDPPRLMGWLVELGVMHLRSDVRAMVNARPIAPNLLPRQPPSSVPVRYPSEPARGLEEAITLSTYESELSYRMRRPGGAIVGPLRLAKMLEMVATARAGVDTLVSRAEGPFLPISAMHELARLAARPAYRFFDPVALLATERAAIERLTLPARFYALAFQGRSCLVAASTGVERFRCFFSRGELGAVASTDATELLGAALVRAGRIDPVLLDELLEEGFRRGERIGDTLVAKDVLDASELERELGAQRVRRLASLFQWQRGDLVLIDGMSDGEDNATAVAPEPVSRAVRAAYREREIAELFAGLRLRRVRRTPEFDARLPLLGLEPNESSLVQAFAKGGILADLVARCADRQGVAWRALFIAWSASLLTVEGSPL